MAGINFVRRWVMSQMTKKADDGIMITLPDSSKVDLNVNITMDRLLRNGIDPDAFTNPEQVNNAINMLNTRMVSRTIPADSAEGREITQKIFGKQKAPVFDLEGNRIPEGSGIMGGKSIKSLMDSGQVSKGARGMKKSKKVEDREMFQAANERLTSDVNSIINNIKSMEPITAMKEANSVIGRKGKYKNLTQEQSKKILQDTEDHIFQRDIPEEDFATGGRAGFKGGYLASGAKQLGKKYKGSTLSAILENPKLLGAELGHDGIMEVMRLLPSLFATGGRAGYKSGLSVEEMLNEERRKKGVEEDPLTSTNTIPNLLDPKVMSNIAIETGLPTTTQKFDTGGYFQEKLDYPSASDASTIKSIQDFKRGPDRFTAPEISDFMGVDGIFNGLNSEQVQSIYDKVETDDSDPYADIQNQTAGLGVASFLVDKLGPKIGGAIFNYGKNKILNKGKNVFIDKPIQKILKTSGGSKKIKTGGGGGGGGSSQANVGGGNTAKNSKGQTASQATKAGTGTSQGYSQHYADGGITRANFVGGGMGRRGFLKMLAGLGGGIAAAKTGLLKFAGKEPAKQVAKEVVKQSASTPPPYFFKLAEKIKMLGDDATATTDRTIAKTLKSKDGKSTYLLEEDVTSGDTIIKKINKEGDEMITDVEIMELKKGEVVKGKDGKAMKTPDEYEEVTEANARIEGDTFNDPYFTDGIEIDDILREVDDIPVPKASGGIARMLGE